MAETPAAPVKQVVLQKIYVKDASLEIPLAPQVFTRVGARDQQQIVDHAGELLHAADDARQRLLVFLRGLVAAAQRDLGLPADRGRRRAQFVAEVGEELASALVQQRQGPVRRFQIAGTRLHGPFEAATRRVRLSAVLLQLSRHRVEVLRDTVELVA